MACIMNSKFCDIQDCTNAVTAWMPKNGSYVCCRPIEFMIESDGSEMIRVDTYTDDESII